MTIYLDKQQVTNGAEDLIENGMPYRLAVKIQGIAPLLFHAWNSEAIDEKSKAAKGSKSKKEDNIETYVYRNNDGYLGIPGANFAATVATAGRFMQDPRSPRKSALDLCKAGIIPLDHIALFQPYTQKWDYEDRRRVTVQRAGITRTRPAMREGWAVEFNLLINTPEYLPPMTMLKLIGDAGRLVGLCDFRPTYGRFTVMGSQVLEP